MPLTAQLVNDLSSGPVCLFADWPNNAVSTFGAGVYTIWHKDGRFIYVGMSGRGITTVLAKHGIVERDGKDYRLSTDPSSLSRENGMNWYGFAMRRSAHICKSAGRRSSPRGRQVLSSDRYNVSAF